MEHFFHLKEHGTDIRTEVRAGLITFFAMVYILMVNAGMFSNPFGTGENPLGVSYGAIYIATALSAVIGTLLVGLLANLPLAMASGMGINAFFVYTVCIGFGFTYANALVLVLLDGLIFVVLTVTGLRRKIFDAIPLVVRSAIPVGIGLFIALLGLQNAGLIIADSSTGTALVSMNLFHQNWGQIMPCIVTIAALLFIAVLQKKQVKGAVLWGMTGASVLYYLLGLTVPGFYAGFQFHIVHPLDAFREFGSQAFGKVVWEGFDFSAYIAAHGSGSFLLSLATGALAFCMVDMFDTLGTLYAACESGGLLTSEGEVPNMEKAMFSDAAATMIGSVCGTSTVTTFSESAAGVAEGGRTGLTSVVTACGFLAAMFLSPVAQFVPSCATAAVLIYVGVLMMESVKNIDWTSMESAVPAFLTMAMMPFAYNISYGIAFGMIAYVVVYSFTGKAKEIRIASWVIVLLFLAMLFLTH